MIPETWEFVLLALAAFRIFWFVGEDAIVDRPRAWLIARLGPKFDELIQCPWCAGTWIVLLGWLGWLIFPTGVVFLAVPLAGMAVLGMLVVVVNALIAD